MRALLDGHPVLGKVVADTEKFAKAAKETGNESLVHALEAGSQKPPGFGASPDSQPSGAFSQ
jgi:hypothetical protein